MALHRVPFLFSSGLLLILSVPVSRSIAAGRRLAREAGPARVGQDQPRARHCPLGRCCWLPVVTPLGCRTTACYSPQVLSEPRNLATGSRSVV
jgi:hypothetical protein